MTASAAIPTAPKALPVLGHLVPMLREPLTFLTSLAAHGDLVQIRLGPIKVIVICDLDLTRQVLLNDRTFDKGGPLYYRAREVGGDGLVTCSHTTHRRLRRLVQPAFHHTHLPGYAQAMTAVISDTTKSWSDNRILDVLGEMTMIASRILTATMFSGTLPAPVYRQLLDDNATLLRSVYRRMLTPPPFDRLPTRANRAYQDARIRVRATLDRLVAERRSNGTDHDDLLSILLAAHDPNGKHKGLTDSEITDTLVAFFTAGTETTAATVAWALYELARHPHIAHRLHAEVDTVLTSWPATYDTLPHLKLTNYVINETLRLHPPGWFFTRTVTTATQLGGHSLPAGSTVAYSPYLLHHSALFDNPTTFSPDRWDTQSLSRAHIPFGAGARQCIGDTFSMIEVTLILASLVANWHWELLPGQNIRPALAATLHPRALRMRACRRS